MIDLGALKLSIQVDGEQATKELNKAKDNISDFGSKIKTGLVNATKIAATGITAIGGAAIALVESTREYRTEQAKLETAFESAGFAADSAKETYSQLNAILGDSGQATEAANHLAKLCDSEEELATWTDIATGVYATFGDSLPIEGLTEAANETAKTGALTGSLADALNWAGVSEDSFQESLDKCNTEQERQKLITETLNGLYKESAEGYRENASEVIRANEANQKLQDTLATVAAYIEPIITNIKLLAVEGLQWLITQIQTFISQNQQTIEQISLFLQQVQTYFMQTVDQIILVLQDFATLCVAFWNEYGETIISIVTPIWEAIQIIFSTALDVVRGILGIFISAFNGDWGALWDNVKNVFVALWNGLILLVPTLLTALINAFKLQIQLLFNLGYDMFNAIWEGMKSIWNSICSWVEEKVSWLADKLAFWRSGSAEMDGSHRTGLREVPYDGYIAELHKGEMVLTAYEAKQYRKESSRSSGSSVSSIVVNNYSPKALDEAESARQFRKTQRELALGVI